MGGDLEECGWARGDLEECGLLRGDLEECGWPRGGGMLVGVREKHMWVARWRGTQCGFLLVCCSISHPKIHQRYWSWFLDIPCHFPFEYTISFPIQMHRSIPHLKSPMACPIKKWLSGGPLEQQWWPTGAPVVVELQWWSTGDPVVVELQWWSTGAPVVVELVCYKFIILPIILLVIYVLF